MIVCPSCGRENPTDARFCNSCATVLDAVSVAEQRKVVTVLFCDLVGSTALGEATDPEALRARMRRYFEDLRAIVERHGGVVEKFVGDAVMAVFGIPVAHEDDALRAVRAAWEMRVAISAHGFQARVGIDTGEVVVGGEGETLVTGDAVNVAARLEQAAPPGEILIGAHTQRLVRDAVRAELVEPLSLKGKSKPVTAARLLEVADDATSIARRFETPLVGRERERQRLRRDFEDAVADRACRLFTLLGPAGIGKSRLVADFLGRVGDSADLLRGRCLHYGEGITYWPLVEMLVPLGIDPESVVASTPEETRVAFRRLLEARAVDRPQVVVVDDLQWAEPVFVDLVEHVADLSRGAPIFLLCIARTELLDARPSWGGGKLNATSLLLEPLAVEQCGELIERLVAGPALDVALRDKIALTSAGNPLFVEEMVAMVRESGDGDVVVPPTIQALLQARIDSLDGDVRVVLERGAVEGEVFHRGAVAELVPGDVRPGLDAHLSSLIRTELVRPEGSLIPGEDAYRFRHILIREAAYATLPKGVRAELHERYAEWLERTPGESAFELGEILGYHFEQAYRFRCELGDADEQLAARAAARLVPAGRAALGRADFSAAKRLLERGIELLPKGDPMRPEALLELGHTLLRLGELESAETVLRSAIADAQGTGNVPKEGQARLALNSVRARLHPESSVEHELREALEIAETLEREGDRSALANAFLEIGMCRFMLGRAGDGDVDLERAAELARQAGDEAMERAALSSRLRLIAWGPIPARDGIAFCDRLMERDIANVADKAHAMQVRALCLAMQGDPEGARTSSAHAMALIEEFGLTLHRGIYAADVGYAESLAGDLERAERELRRGHDLLFEIGDVGVRSTVDALLSDVLTLQGRDDEALAFAEESRAIASADDLDSQPRWRVARARIASRRGAHDEAMELLHEALELLAPTDFIGLKAHVHDVLGEVLLESGRVDEAIASLERAIALHEQKGNIVSAERSRSAYAGIEAGRRS